MDELNKESDKESNKPPTDIFHWANAADQRKGQLDIELYLFSKNYTVYATNYAAELKMQLGPLFVYDMINEVQTGAAMGLRVRDFEDSEAQESVLARTHLSNVQHAQEVMEQVIHGADNLEIFSENEHEFKRIKGVIAKCSGEGVDDFYIIKLLPTAQVLKGATAWQFDSGTFKPFAAEAGLRITPDNQVLLVGDDIFAFSESKFERLFGYDAKKQAVAEEKVRAIEAVYRLSLPDDLTLDALVKEKKALVNKLQKLDTDSLVPVETLMQQAEEMEIELMQDETEAIILMDESDVKNFVNLINDDYMESPMTGYKYEIKSKRRLDAPEEASPKPVNSEV